MGFRFRAHGLLAFYYITLMREEMYILLVLFRNNVQFFFSLFPSFFGTEKYCSCLHSLVIVNLHLFCFIPNASDFSFLFFFFFFSLNWGSIFAFFISPR